MSTPNLKKILMLAEFPQRVISACVCHGEPVNQLYYRDCLAVMQREMNVNSVDLIYIDPPFNSNRAYNAIYKDETGRPLPDQIEAFCDLWTLDHERERAIRKMPEFMRSQSIDEML